MSESANPFTFDEDDFDDGLLTLSPRPRPADYDPLAPRKQAFSLRELRLKREAEAAGKTIEDSGTGIDLKEEN